MTRLPLLLLGACAHTIADPGALTLAPTTSELAAAELKVCWVEFATGTLPHKLSVAHGALDEDVVSTASGLLLVHPKGTWLIDGGLVEDTGPSIDEVRGLQRAAIRQAAKGWTRVAMPDAAVRALGVDPATLTGGIPTHGHFDHLGGLLTLPNLPIWMPQAEIDLAKQIAAEGGATILPPDARAVVPRATAIPWDGGPALYWDQSHDLYGDGSVVLIPLPGHTPGSLGALVQLPTGRAVFLVGDTVWVREGYEQREPKSGLASSFDSDSELNDQQIGKLWTLHQAQPDLTILPAHDRRQWEAAFGQPGCVGG